MVSELLGTETLGGFAIEIEEIRCDALLPAHCVLEREEARIFTQRTQRCKARKGEEGAGLNVEWAHGLCVNGAKEISNALALFASFASLRPLRENPSVFFS